MNGLILLPNAWEAPEGITFKSGFHSSFGSDYYVNYQSFTAAQWSTLEQAGAVFLPAAGIRYGTHVNYVHDEGSYWSATAFDEFDSYMLDFYSSTASMSDDVRYYGRSVRLVRDIVK